MIMHPTNEMRLYGTVLQQKWIDMNKPMSSEEWRDVPVVDPAPKIEVGKWYWIKDTRLTASISALINYQGEEKQHYGFNHSGNFVDYFGNAWVGNSIVTEASPEEVKERLIAEAKKRGFVKGVFAKCLENFIGNEGQIEELFFHSNIQLWAKTTGQANCLIMKDGKWAEIIPAKAKYPTKIEEVEGRKWYLNNFGEIEELPSDGGDPNKLSSKERGKAFLALMQLVELRDAWNKIDGFVVNWKDSDVSKKCIVVETGEISTASLNHSCHVLCFGSETTRDLFLETFRPLIEEAKELI